MNGQDPYRQLYQAGARLVKAMERSPDEAPADQLQAGISAALNNLHNLYTFLPPPDSRLPRRYPADLRRSVLLNRRQRPL